MALSLAKTAAFRIIAVMFALILMMTAQLAASLYVRKAQIDIRAVLDESGDDAARTPVRRISLDSPARAAGVSEAQARGDVALATRQFNPTQSCTAQMYSSAKRELRVIESTLTPQARYRLWVHREAIRAYLDTHVDEAIRMARAYSQTVSPIACELTVGALAVARRG